MIRTKNPTIRKKKGEKRYSCFHLQIKDSNFPLWKQANISNLCFLQQWSESYHFFLATIKTHIRNHIHKLFQRKLSIFLLIFLEVLYDVVEEPHFTWQNQTTVALKPKLLFGFFKETREYGEVKETRGDGKTLAFRSNVDEDKTGRCASCWCTWFVFGWNGVGFGVIIKGAATKAHVFPTHHELLQTHDLANLIDFFHRTCHWRSCKTHNGERERKKERESAFFF